MTTMMTTILVMNDAGKPLYSYETSASSSLARRRITRQSKKDSSLLVSSTSTSVPKSNSSASSTSGDVRMVQICGYLQAILSSIQYNPTTIGNVGTIESIRWNINESSSKSTSSLSSSTSSSILLLVFVPLSIANNTISITLVGYTTIVNNNNVDNTTTKTSISSSAAAAITELTLRLQIEYIATYLVFHMTTTSISISNNNNNNIATTRSEYQYYDTIESILQVQSQSSTQNPTNITTSLLSSANNRNSPPCTVLETILSRIGLNNYNEDDDNDDKDNDNNDTDDPLWDPNNNNTKILSPYLLNAIECVYPISYSVRQYTSNLLHYYCCCSSSSTNKTSSISTKHRISSLLLSATTTNTSPVPSSNNDTTIYAVLFTLTASSTAGSTTSASLGQSLSLSSFETPKVITVVQPNYPAFHMKYPDLQILMEFLARQYNHKNATTTTTSSSQQSSSSLSQLPQMTGSSSPSSPQQQQQRTEPELWIPICLPHTNSSSFMYCYANGLTTYSCSTSSSDTGTDPTSLSSTSPSPSCNNERNPSNGQQQQIIMPDTTTTNTSSNTATATNTATRTNVTTTNKLVLAFISTTNTLEQFHYYRKTADEIRTALQLQQPDDDDDHDNNNDTNDTAAASRNDTKVNIDKNDKSNNNDDDENTNDDNDNDDDDFVYISKHDISESSSRSIPFTNPSSSSTANLKVTAPITATVGKTTNPSTGSRNSTVSLLPELQRALSLEVSSSLNQLNHPYIQKYLDEVNNSNANGVVIQHFVYRRDTPLQTSSSSSKPVAPQQQQQQWKRRPNSRRVSSSASDSSNGYLSQYLSSSTCISNTNKNSVRQNHHERKRIRSRYEQLILQMRLNGSSSEESLHSKSLYRTPSNSATNGRSTASSSNPTATRIGTPQNQNHQATTTTVLWLDELIPVAKTITDQCPVVSFVQQPPPLPSSSSSSLLPFQQKHQPNASHRSATISSTSNNCFRNQSSITPTRIAYLRDDSNDELYLGSIGDGFELYCMTSHSTTPIQQLVTTATKLVYRILQDEDILFISDPLTWEF